MKITKQDLEKIGRFTKKEMSPDELYVFSLILCDNDIDRDGEKFTADSLEKLASLIIGKTGIFDHNMSSKDQIARIFDAKVTRAENRLTADGEPYVFLSAKAYMLKNEKNRDLISEIEAGIKKETSVGCSVKSIKCSVCGRDIRSGACAHKKGEIYDGKKCCHLLCDPEDAYEWSFVAVPAQRNAGIVKAFTPAAVADRELEEYRAELKSGVISNAASLIPQTGRELINKICNSLPLAELRELRNSLKKDAERNSPLCIQLASPEKAEKETNSEYII